jgi:hypothetical protein
MSVLAKAAQPGIPAHIQRTTIRIEEMVPYHPTRTDDPYYHIFNQQRNRMKKLGLLICAVCGAKDGEKEIEVHHTEVEFSMSEGIDVAKFAALHPDLNITDDATFQAFVEGEHNLTPLCVEHHTGMHGIHVLPYPFWNLQKYWKTDLGDPAHAIQGDAGAKASDHQSPPTV